MNLYESCDANNAICLHWVFYICLGIHVLKSSNSNKHIFIETWIVIYSIDFIGGTYILYATLYFTDDSKLYLASSYYDNMTFYSYVWFFERTIALCYCYRVHFEVGVLERKNLAVGPQSADAMIREFV